MAMLIYCACGRIFSAEILRSKCVIKMTENIEPEKS